MIVPNPFGPAYPPLDLPSNAILLSMKSQEPLKDAKSAIKRSLESPISSKSLREIALEKKKKNPNAKAVIVISDNTRPVPYKGDEGLVIPIIETLLDSAYKTSDITLLIATGMHREMEEDEIWQMVDPRVRELGIRVVNHLPMDKKRLSLVGITKAGTKAMVDSIYVESDLKILTGLVESHFMAGFSGGRKSICPGLIGVESTYLFHGPAFMSDPRSRDLNIEDNPVSNEALEVAKLAGADFIVNVTLDESFRITGVFSGDLEKAHEKAVEEVKSHVMIPIKERADVVITHGGFVGVNHYQMAKCAVASLGALKDNGFLITLGNTTDKGNKIGSFYYKIALALLKVLESKRFNDILLSKKWNFLPEQWQVQEWAKVFDKIPMDHLYIYAPQIDQSSFDIIPGKDIRALFDDEEAKSSDSLYSEAIKRALEDIEKVSGKKREEMTIYYLMQGPYEIPCIKKD